MTTTAPLETRAVRPWVARLLDSRVLFAVAVAVGLAIRVADLPYEGTHDMDTYSAWGTDVASRGLAAAYGGTYFPLEWQIFGWAAAAAPRLGVSLIFLLKLVNLAFDV